MSLARVPPPDLPAGLERRLGDAISRALVCCTPEVPLGKVVATLHEQRVGCMPVVDKWGAPVGIFTSTDALECLSPPQVALDTEIGRVMTRRPVTLDASATLAEAAAAMAERGFRHVLVTREKRLVGVFSQRDALYWLLDCAFSATRFMASRASVECA